MNYLIGPVSLIGILSTAVVCGALLQTGRTSLVA